MLQISTEFRKGVFFIRLGGRIDNEGYLEEYDELINKVGINLIVLNLTNLNEISLESIKHIINYNLKLLKEKKLLLICDASAQRNNKFKLIPKINNELEAFSLI